MLGRERAYAGRHRHSLRHMYAKNSPQISFWAKRAEPAHRVGRSRPQRSRPPPPPKAGPARCAANGWRQDRLVRGLERPAQALHARKKGSGDGRGPTIREKDEKKKQEKKRRRPRSQRVPTEGGAGVRLAKPAQG